MRFWAYFKGKLHSSTLTHNSNLHLSPEELNTAEIFLAKSAQGRSFSTEIRSFNQSPPIPLTNNSKILCLNPFLGQDGLLHVGGRLINSSLPTHSKHPIILASHDAFVKLLFMCEHLRLSHCGPTLLLSSVGQKYHVQGARRTARTTCSRCTVCRRVSAVGSQQLRGQLPAARVTASHPFSSTGVDYAGPFLTKLGRVRRPVVVKSYLALFVCLATKAVHIEVVSDATTEAFLAALRRFISRRGLHTDIYSDNGSNFKGANADLLLFYRMLEEQATISAVTSYLLQHRTCWHHIPERAPHFGGLWEASVKSCKHHLKRVVNSPLTFEELTTVSAQIEACLNSRPLRPMTSHSPDGAVPLTPGHFLVGRAVTAYPETALPQDPSRYRTWVRAQAMVQHFWARWSQEYLQHLQASYKWKKPTINFKVNDIVLLTDCNTFQAQWVTGKVVATHPGQDGLVKAVDVAVPRVVKPFPTSGDKKKYANDLQIRTVTYRTPIAKLGRLLPEDHEEKDLPLHLL